MFDPSPFQPGRSYRVKKTFSAMRDEFREGDVLRFQSAEYSRYDGVTGYFFVDSEGKIRPWDLRDDESQDVWVDHFETV